MGAASIRGQQQGDNSIRDRTRGEGRGGGGSIHHGYTA